MQYVEDVFELIRTFFSSHPLAIPIAFAITGLFIGIIVEVIISKYRTKVVVGKVKEGYSSTKRIPLTWHFLKVALASTRGFIVLWFILGSLYGAVVVLEIEESTRTTVEEVIFVLFALSIIFATIRIIDGFINARAKSLAKTSIFAILVKVTIALLGLTLVLNGLQIDVTPVLTAFGIAGLGVAFALQDTLANFFAGLHLIASREIKPGNFIRLDTGEEGTIVDINWRSTTLKDLKNYILIIPNSKLVQANITNFDLPSPPVTFVIGCGVSYGSDLQHVEEVTLDVAKYLLNDPEFGGNSSWKPLMRFHTFSDFSVNFNVVVQVMEYKNQFAFKSEFIKRLHKRFKEGGIEIPFPIRTVHIVKE